MLSANAFDMREDDGGVIAEIRANGGKVPGRLATSPLLLLTTIGAKSGQPRTMPLICSTIDGDRLGVVPLGEPPLGAGGPRQATDEPSAVCRVTAVAASRSGRLAASGADGSGLAGR